MGTVSHNVRDLAAGERSVVERLVGQSLSEDQRLVIQIVSLDSTDGSKADGRPAQTIEDWTNVYEGLSDERIEEIDQAVKT